MSQTNEQRQENDVEMSSSDFFKVICLTTIAPGVICLVAIALFALIFEIIL